MCGTTQLLPDEDGTPPWRKPGVRSYVRFLSAFAVFDVLLVAFHVAR